MDGDPVAGIAVLQDAARLLGVMKDGVFHKDPQKGPARALQPARRVRTGGNAA